MDARIDTQRPANRQLPDPSTGTAGQVAKVNAARDGYELAADDAGSGGGVSLAAVKDEIEAYTGQMADTPTGTFARNRLPLATATEPGGISATQAVAVEELTNARGAVSMTLQTDSSGAIVAASPAPADEVGYSVPRAARRIQAADTDVAAALDRLDSAAPNLTDFQKEVFDHFDRGGWEDWAADDAATQAWVANTTEPTGTAQNNPASLVFVRSYAHPGARLTNRRVFIRFPKSLRTAREAGHLRVVSASEIDADHTTYSNIVTSDSWVAINTTDPTWDYYYADPVNLGVGENLEIEQFTRFHSTAEIEDADIPDTIARVAQEHAARTAATSQRAIYNRIQQILQAGTNIDFTADDDDSELTINGAGSGNALTLVADDVERSIVPPGNTGTQERVNPTVVTEVDLDDYTTGVLFIGNSWTLTEGAGALVNGTITANTFAEVTIADLKRSTVYNAGNSDFGVLAGTAEVQDNNGVKKADVEFYVARNANNVLLLTERYVPQNSGPGPDGCG